MRPLCYAGVGARAAPPAVLSRMESIARAYARAGWVLRTGGSPGADQAFLRGAAAAAGRIELYLPWADFEQGALASVAAAPGVEVMDRPTEAACVLAAAHRPGWESLEGGERALLARDCHEVLGPALDAPVRFVLCWTADGGLAGAGVLADGTGQTLRVARASGVPAFNLGAAARLVPRAGSAA